MENDSIKSAPAEEKQPLKRNMRVSEFCERAPMSKSTFWDLVKKGDIAVIRFGALTVIPHDHAEHLLRYGVTQKPVSGTPAAENG